MLLPYRVKNPIRSFPAITVAIIAINVIVYVFTTDSLLVIRENVVKDYAFALGIGSPANFLSSIFLHGDLFHLLGNMLFLWVFGPPVEDRLGKVTYPIVYFTTGLAGALLQATVDKLVTGQAHPGIGASGCIMGIVGAYWFAFSWSKVCVFYWLTFFWRGVFETSAVWIIGLFFLMDLAQGTLYSTIGVSGGVANFAHLGGAVIGALMCMVMQVTRDSAEVSEAKAIQADTKDLSLMPLHVLQSMLEENPGDPEIVRAIIPAALSLRKQEVIDRAFAGAGPSLIEKSPTLVAHYLVDLGGQVSLYQPVHLLRLAGSLEQTGDHTKALHIYKLVADHHPTTPDAESAIYRMAQSYWKVFRDAQRARACLAELDRRFPNGSMAHFSRGLARELEQAPR